MSTHCTQADVEEASADTEADTETAPPIAPDSTPAHRVAKMTPEEVVEAYAGLVKSTGQDLLRRLSCPVPLEDLIAWGYQGLLEAHLRFDPSMDVSFPSFAFYRIRGAMYDGLRAAGWAVRGTAINLRDNIAVNDYLESNLLSDAQMPGAKTLGDCVNYLDSMVGNCVTICLVENTRLELITGSEGSHSGVDQVERHELTQAIAKALKHLSPSERDILLRYHVEGYSMTELAEELGCSKSWVSRINARAIQKVRRFLYEDNEEWGLYMFRG